MGEGSVRQTARRAALDAQAGQRRERQERDRRIDALAVEVLVALGERDAAERRAGELLPDDDRSRTAFAAAGGRLARRPDHGPRDPFVGLAHSNTPMRSPTRTACRARA